MGNQDDAETPQSTFFHGWAELTNTFDFNDIMDELAQSRARKNALHKAYFRINLGLQCPCVLLYVTKGLAVIVCEY